MQLAILGVVAIFGVVAMVAFGNAQSSTPPPPVASGIRIFANVLGNANAPATIEEWADFQCPACRAFALGTEPQLRTEYIAPGKVRFVFRHMAFIGLESVWAGEAAECAGEQNHFSGFSTIGCTQRKVARTAGPSPRRTCRRSRMALASGPA